MRRILDLKFGFTTFALAWIATGTPLLLAKEKKANPKATGSVIENLKLIEGDEHTNEVRAVKTELMISRSELKAIEQVQALLKKYRGSKMEAELQFRLAELYMRRAKTARFFEINRQSETVVKLAPRVVANANSRRYVEKAIDTYELIQRKFPGFKQLDLVVFNNAFARQALGQEKEAERLYWNLIKNFRNSPLVPDCHLAIGEINFDRSNFSFALEHFNAIKRYPEARVYPYGLYKAAWTHYNLRDAEAALKKLEEVIAYGRYVSEKRIEQRLDLRKEALNDLTIFYEDARAAKDAFPYFKKQAGELDVAPIILRLAKLYEHHSRYVERQVVLSEFIRNLADSPLVAEIQGELIWNYDSMKKKDLAVGEMEKLQQLCMPTSSWLRKQKPTAEGVSPRENCLGILRDTTMKLAGRWLKIWKKNPAIAGDFAEAAEKAFAIYLQEPGEAQQVNEARFAYAELLFQRGKYRQASGEYAMVSDQSQNKTLKHDASYAAVVSLEKAVGDKWSDKDEQSFHSLASKYVEMNPKGTYRLDLEFKMALIAYEKSRYDEAGPTFLRLGKDYAKTEKGQRAQDLYLDILNLKKDYKGLKTYSLALLKVENDAGRKTKLQKIHEQAFFLEIQAFEDSKNYDDAIAGYKEFVAANPKSDLAEKAWWNAVQLHYKILDFSGGAKAAEQYYDRFPTASNALDALLKAAQSYESLGQLEPAADVLSRIAKVEPKNALKWNTLAADFYLLSNSIPKAKKLFADLKNQGDAKARSDVLNKLLVLERNEGGSEYRTILQAVANAGVEPQASMARVEILEEILKAGKDTEAFNEAKKIVGASGASPLAKSRARMVQAKVLESEFLRQSVKTRAEKVATVLAIKTEKLEKAQQAFQQAIRYGDPNVTVEALRRLAGCYTHYVDALKKMPLPRGLTTEDEAAFRDEISQLVIPLEEKAIETLQEGIRTADKLRVTSPLVAEMEKDLKKMNMPVPTGSDLLISSPEIALPTVAGVGP